MLKIISPKLLIFFIFILSQQLYFSQCITGILMTNCGGCQSGCNLTSFGGPNCASLGNPTGNCSSVQNLSTDINVPAGCSYTVSATMTSRPGCGSGSGADNGDQIKVDNISGSKSFINGASNGTIADAFTLSGPGTIRISAKANRRDEITTYTINSTGINGASCPSCFSSLPVELISFDISKLDRSVELNWKTASENNNDYFTLEKSSNGIDFEPFYEVKGLKNSSSIKSYTFVDVYAYQGFSYYRLKQTDINGTTKIVGIRTVDLSNNEEFNIFPNPTTDFVYITHSEIANSTIEVYSNIGQRVTMEIHKQDNICTLNFGDLAKGYYFLKITNDNTVKMTKIELH